MLMKKTYSPKLAEIERRWYVVDADGVPLGRLATLIATRLRGKHKPTFAPHVDNGDFVIVINADKVALTGNKRETKLAYRHSGYPGGLRSVTYAELLEKRPERAIASLRRPTAAPGTESTGRSAATASWSTGVSVE